MERKEKSKFRVVRISAILGIDLWSNQVEILTVYFWHEVLHWWRFCLELPIHVNDLHLPAFSDEKPDDKTDGEWELCHRKVCEFMRLWVEDNFLNHICEEIHARTMWNKLESLCAPKTDNNKMFLIKQMMELKYQDGAPMLDLLNTFQGILNQLSKMNIELEDEIHGLLVLGTLLDSWKIIRTSLLNSVPNGAISMDLVKSSVLNEEMRRKSQSSSLQSDVLVTEKREKSKSKGLRGNSRSKSKSNWFANVECYYCHEKWHIKKYCRKLKRDNKNHKGREKKIDDDSDVDTIIVATEDFYILSEGDVVNLATQQSN